MIKEEGQRKRMRVAVRRKGGCAQCFLCIIRGARRLEDSDMLSVEH